MINKNINTEVKSLITSESNDNLYSLIIRETLSGPEYYKLPITYIKSLFTGTNDPDISDISGLSTSLSSKEIISNRNVKDGYVGLDLSNKIPKSLVNITGGLNYLGTYDPITNTPVISDSPVPPTSYNNGDFYRVSEPGQRIDVASNAILSIGDWVVWTGSGWTAIHKSASPVISVNTLDGNVTLNHPSITPPAGTYTGIRSISVTPEGFVTAIDALTTVENLGIVGVSLEASSNWSSVQGGYNITVNSTTNPTFGGIVLDNTYNFTAGQNVTIELDIEPIGGIITTSEATGTEIIGDFRTGNTIESPEISTSNINFDVTDFTNLSNNPGTITKTSITSTSATNAYLHIAGPFGTTISNYTITGVRVSIV